MCGIAGIAGTSDPEQGVKAIERMVASLSRRGPDDSGTECWERAVLGHRRLSIFDISKSGHQPMMGHGNEVGLVFNGAIYNFRDLRRELESVGFAFKSETDTEVLLHGYAAWGIDKLTSKIDGMFAFGIWDNRINKLFLVRDRLGVKPLVFSVKDKELAFASTVRALKAGGFGGDVSERGVLEFLEFGFLTDENAIFEDIQKLGAGELLEWHNGILTKRTYWNVPVSVENQNVSFDDAVEETERLILLAVEKRLHADVPVGALLSGGIDSSLVCWAISKLGSDIKAFTVSTPEDKFDESDQARATAEKLGIDVQILRLSGQALPDVFTLIKAFSEPFACSSALGMLAIAKEVSGNAKVLLTGDGGDDVFLGYPEHRHFFLASKLAGYLPASILTAWSSKKISLPRSGILKRAGSFVEYMSGGLGAVTQVRDGLPFYRNQGLLGERLESISFSHREIKRSGESGRNLINDFLKYDIQTRFVGEYLPKVDGSTMFHGLEARSPFLDVDLWNFASSLPIATRLHRLRLKAILREITRRRIGPEVATRRKQGFMIPAQRWLTKEWRQNMIDILDKGLVERLGIIDTEATLKAFDAYAPGDVAPRQFWFIYILELWLRHEYEAMPSSL